MAIMYLYQKQIKPTPMAIIEVTSTEIAKKAIDEMGGIEYLMLIEESHVDANNLKIFIDKIKQAYTRRTLYEISDDVKDFVLSEEAEVLNPTELVSEVQNKLSDLIVDTSKKGEIYKMGDDTENVLLHRESNPTAVAGLEVGWRNYDILTGGALPGDLIIVCAPSKTGKSVTLTNWATNLSVKSDIPVLYFDTEMNEREQEDRVLANLSGVPQHEIVNGMYTLDTAFGKSSDKIQRIKEARELLKSANFFHVYLPKYWAVA